MGGADLLDGGTDTPAVSQRSEAGQGILCVKAPMHGVIPRHNGNFWLRKKPMDLCACESEEHEHGVGAGANNTLLYDTL
jgi:hypothetical protein